MPEARRLSYIESVNAAIGQCLATDPSAIVFGEDVAKPGGVFGATKGLATQFPGRVFDTPISEAAILGSAVGAAMLGLKPIVEIMWVDFSLVALDQIVNQAANVRYVFNGTLTAPITIRTQQGALPGSCAQHSQSLEAIFAHIPGLRVCLPSTPQDAYDLLVAAAAAADPVVVIEHRKLYFGPKDDVTLSDVPQPLGGARVRRHGSSCTAVTWGAITNDVIAAAELLVVDGFEIEVIDARWLAPFDWDMVGASVARTGRCLVVHEANVTGGFGAEVAAGVSERWFHSLDAPVRRLGAPDLRMPAAPTLQAAVVPTVARIVEQLRQSCQE